MRGIVRTDSGDPILRAAREFWRLPDDEFDRLLALTHEADSVELKFIVPESAHDLTCDVLGIDFTRARARRVYFLDTADLALQRHGVVARVRSIENRPDDSVIKLRPLVPCDLPAPLRRSEHFVVEVDGMPGGYVCSGTLKERLGMNEVRQVMAKGRPLHDLFSEPQQALLTAHAPLHVDLDGLAVFGPVDVRRRKLRLDDSGYTLVAEQWRYPDGSRLLELSTRCRAEASLEVAARTAVTLRANRIDLTQPQRTKTRVTFDFFARHQPAAR